MLYSQYNPYFRFPTLNQELMPLRDYASTTESSILSRTQGSQLKVQELFSCRALGCRVPGGARVGRVGKLLKGEYLRNPPGTPSFENFYLVWQTS